MSLLFWKSNKNIDEFANALATEFYSNVGAQYVSGLEPDLGARHTLKQQKKAGKTLENEIKKLIENISRFKLVNKLGVYGKARLHMKFRYRLIELGIEESIVDALNEEIMLKTP